MDMASENSCLQKIGLIVPGAFIPPTDGGNASAMTFVLL
jgi:hypothetical protein